MDYNFNQMSTEKDLGPASIIQHKHTGLLADNEAVMYSLLCA